MWVRYADGRAAITHGATCELGPAAITIQVGDAQHVWPYAELRRADDGAERIILKRHPDTGERLYLDLDAAAPLRAAAPELFGDRAFGIEGRATIGALAAAAWSLAAVFLLGVPLLADPIAQIMPPRYRNQIADISWSQVQALTAYCDNTEEAARILNTAAHRIMTQSNVANRDDIWITILDAPFPNAFALPDNSIVVTDDLIFLAEQPDELIGVIAHEIAHIEHNHIMKNIVRSVGAGIFFDVVFGGAGAGQAVAIASVNLAGLRFSRGDETDADNRGIDYLVAAGIDPAALARMFDRFEALSESEGGAIPTLLSSHPATPERAAAARARAIANAQPSISDADWQIVRASCGGPPAPEEETPPAPGKAPKPRSAT